VLTEPGAVLAAALELAARITANAPVAVQQSRKVVATETFGSEAAAWQASGEAMGVAMTSPDMQEGVKAFLEKRAPQWTGK
jgi:enoyl-CoA hydratase